MDFSDVLSQYPNPVLLDQGGQKAAYRTKHPVYGQIVLKLGAVGSPAQLERIRREVAVLREINSPYYPKNFDFQVVTNNRFYTIEEYIESETLSCCFGKICNPLHVICLVRHLVLGLNVLWEKRIVHRDVKPKNILVTVDGTPRIIDLGIARLLDMDSLTNTFALRGPCTPGYAAPEQLRNRKAQIDRRSDQFALGITMMQLLLEGKHPFDPVVVGTGDSIVNNILAGKWDKSIFSRDEFIPLRPVAEKLLGKEPFQRYKKVDDLLNDLDKCIEVLS